MHSGGGRYDDDNHSTSPIGEEQTRIFNREEREQETVIMPPNRGMPPASPGRDQRGTLIGVADIERGVRIAGQPGGAGANAPAATGGNDQGATIFIPAGAAATAGDKFDPAVGWLVIIKGKGRGHSRPVYYGQNSIGRGPDMRIQIDFGDQRISRDAHAYLIYDDANRKYFLKDNGKSNLVRHKGNVVMQPTEIHDRDEVTIGETTMLFVSLCGPTFDWLTGNEPSKA